MSIEHESFSQKVKDEIINRKKNKQEATEFIRGLIFTNALIQNDEIELFLRDPKVFKNVVDLLKKYEIKYALNNLTIIIKQDDFNIDEQFDNPSLFFAGTFIGGGSINDIDKSSYHLQISSNYEKFIDIIKNKLNEYDFNFVKIKHKNKYLIYIKKMEKIQDFLKAILATESLFYFMDQIISRDFNNNINRINNIDMSNMKKIANANIKEQNNINYLKEHKLEKYFNINELNFYDLLLENVSESLNNLCIIYNQKYNANYTKSGVYHWLSKLKKIISKHQKEAKNE